MNGSFRRGPTGLPLFEFMLDRRMDEIGPGFLRPEDGVDTFERPLREARIHPFRPFLFPPQTYPRKYLT